MPAPVRHPTCPCCHQSQPRFFCSSCIHQAVSTQRDVSHSIHRQISTSIDQANGHLDHAIPRRSQQAWRQLRADVSRREQRCHRLSERIEAIERDLLLLSSKPRSGSVAAVPTIDGSSHLAQALQYIERQQLDVTRRLTDARGVLVREAVSVFGVCKTPKQGWEIARLPLPSPELFRLHRSNRINAALGHTIHLLSLIIRYLSVAIPFYPHQTTPHIGRPIIKANAPFVSTTRFHDDPVLWMSSTARSDTADKPKSQLKQRRFLTAFGLLAHSVGYLAHSQGTVGVGIPQSDREGQSPAGLVPVWSILQLIYSLASSPDLGTFTHDPGGQRTSPHLLYGLDVAKVVGSVIKAEERRWGNHKLDASDLSDGWDLMESADEA